MCFYKAGEQGMQEFLVNWQEFIKYLSDTRDWHRFIDERGITHQVARDIETFMYWFAHDKEPFKKDAK